MAKQFQNLGDKQIVLDMKQKLNEKFASKEHSGPNDIADFMDILDEGDFEMIKRDAYEQVQALLQLI